MPLNSTDNMCGELVIRGWNKRILQKVSFGWSVRSALCCTTFPKSPCTANCSKLNFWIWSAATQLVINGRLFIWSYHCRIHHLVECHHNNNICIFIRIQSNDFIRSLLLINLFPRNQQQARLLSFYWIRHDDMAIRFLELFLRNLQGIMLRTRLFFNCWSMYT